MAGRSKTSSLRYTLDSRPGCGRELVNKLALPGSPVRETNQKREGAVPGALPLSTQVFPNAVHRLRTPPHSPACPPPGGTGNRSTGRCL